MQKNNWFEVDVEGLRALQKGKSKTFIVRELVQNAWDENIKNCKLKFNFFNDRITVTIQDDNPEGFKNLRDAYTLFSDTAKRRNVGQRGRFNFGEKQLISICNQAMIKTTKGTITFTESGRHEIDEKTEEGSIVTIEINGTEKEYQEMVNYAKLLLVPKGIIYWVNNEVVNYIKPFKTFDVVLLTEVDEDGFLKRVSRKSKVNLLKEGHPRIYEMGLPIMEIDCEFSIDVQQKVPLSFDRDSIIPSFMKDIYAAVLNNAYMDIEPENMSSSWLKIAMGSKNANREAISQILRKRYGDNYVVANSFDSRSVDEAIANGYKVITGSEMSKEEWANIKEYDLIQSSSDLFGTNFSNAPTIVPNQNQEKTADYAKRIAKRFLGFDIGVGFVKGGSNMVTAQYGDRQLIFNISRLNNGFFDNPISVRTTDLILHELGHEAGHHTEESYHRLITKLGAELTMLALKEKKFFEEVDENEGIGADKTDTRAD